MVALPRALPPRPRYPRASYPAMPRDLRQLLAMLVAAAVLGAALLHLLAAPMEPPTSLSKSQLAGTRTLTGRACLGIAADVSGSMNAVTQARQEATAELLSWLRTQVRPDDEIAIALFTDAAAITLSATPTAEAPANPPPDVLVGSGNTVASTAVTALGNEFQGRGCAAFGLLAITDGEVGDSPQQLRDALLTAAVTRVGTLNPKGSGRAAQLNHPELSAITVHDVKNADDISLAYGQLVADLTGQHLVKTR